MINVCYTLIQCWGKPKKYIQFSNFSSQWNLEVNWVDEDGCLVPRHELKAGKTHFELCSPDHVWTGNAYIYIYIYMYVYVCDRKT